MAINGMKSGMNGGGDGCSNGWGDNCSCGNYGIGGGGNGSGGGSVVVGDCWRRLLNVICMDAEALPFRPRPGSLPRPD